MKKDSLSLPGDMGIVRPLSIGIRTGYGAAEAGIAAVEVLIQVYLLKFYIEFVGLSTGLAGIALALAVLWDALTDPAMGHISDASPFRAGRRRVYILTGSIALAVLFPLLFHPPALESQAGKFAFLLGSYMLVNTAMTVLSIPHTAFGGELTPDPNERTVLFGFRLLAGNVGFLAGTILPGIYLSLIAPSVSVSGGAETANATGDPGTLMAASRAWSSWIISGLVLSTGLITFHATRGRDAPGTAAVPLAFFVGHYFDEIVLALRNRYFVILLIAFFVATIGRTMNASIALLYYQYFLKLEEQTVALYVLGPFMAFISLSVILWVLVSRRFGKKIPAIVGVAGLGLMTTFAYPNFSPGSLVGPIFAALLGGLLVGSVILLDSLVADIVDYDTLKRGRNREGLYFGFWRMVAKAARAVGLAMTSYALTTIGFQENGGAESPEVARGLALLFGPGVGLFFIAGAAIFAFLPWSADRHTRIRALLERKNALK